MSCESCGCDREADWVCASHCAKAGWAYPLTRDIFDHPVTVGDIIARETPSNPSEDASFPTDPLLSDPQLGLPLDAKSRKEHPIATGVLDYFPFAIIAIAAVSYAGNQQHHPGQPLHWDRTKSTDEADALMRHFLQRGTLDTDGIRHSAKVAWRALALLQKEIEGEKA